MKTQDTSRPSNETFTLQQYEGYPLLPTPVSEYLLAWNHPALHSSCMLINALSMLQHSPAPDRVVTCPQFSSMCCLMVLPHKASGTFIGQRIMPSRPMLVSGHLMSSEQPPQSLCEAQ